MPTDALQDKPQPEGYISQHFQRKRSLYYVLNSRILKKHDAIQPNVDLFPIPSKLLPSLGRMNIRGI
jgi:hypothetical protein